MHVYIINWRVVHRQYLCNYLLSTHNLRRNRKVLPLGITALQPQSHFHLGMPYTYICIGHMVLKVNEAVVNRVQAGLRNCSIPGTGRGCFTSLKSPNMPTQWVPAAYSTGVKQSGHNAVHASPSTCKLRNVQSWIFPLCHTPSLVWCLTF
jgi:hypothetical protein